MSQATLFTDLVIPESVVKDDADHAMNYSQNLPYPAALDGEAEEWLNELCVNIAICVKARDWSPGCLFWDRLDFAENSGYVHVSARNRN
ncbi:hypothetical protein BC936DRAFT_139497 [Jimgerdemannia flammicorona]|uniref:Uncharacterized protein n=1 Tax=Jimgerdemannia flammicorona TaxID=994334 RepID=A0A433B9T1_9FUNG|nr:hypothetical protein BC936DRAFT_139497 [Jimgerdemannia flammicorona]